MFQVYVRTHLKSLNMSMEAVRTLVRAEAKTYTVYVVAPLVSRVRAKKKVFLFCKASFFAYRGYRHIGKKPISYILYI